jgi:hypothetical protein
MEYSELRSELQTLSDRSLRTSRKLDDTYYSLLEKVSIFRQTIGNLQELSDLTKELHENFQSDTVETVEEIQGPFDNFNNFDTQEQQIAELEERIQVGREKAERLTARLRKAQEHVEARSKTEAEGEAKTTSTQHDGLSRNLILTTLQDVYELFGQHWGRLWPSLSLRFSSISSDLSTLLRLLGLPSALSQEAT